jgi:hypothetical protein
VCALALVLVLSLAAAAAAKGPVAGLRVIGAGGKVLDEDSFGAGTTSIATSPKAECFGKGTGGSGKSVTLQGPTALGMLIQASKFTPALKPVLISDHFSFGLALCGVGGQVVSGEASWYLKINHKSLSVGGDKAKVKAGDEVLWDLAPSYPYPDELALSAPATATAGKPFQVTVYSYDEKGKRKPAEGATVSGAGGPTDSKGHAMVTLSKPARLFARDGDDIPSGRVAVCVGGKCPGGGAK